MLGPIFAREWLTLPRRPQHYALRAAYLGTFLILGLTAWQSLVGWTRPASLGDTARFGVVFFRTSVCFQLTLLLFFSAMSAAATVAQEKDRRTFVLLLLTDLRNHEIVLGKLFGSLLQIGLLLLGSAAMLAIGLLLGGVSFSQLADAVLILAATSLAAGSLGCVVALWRDQTFQSLAMTVLLLVLYFCLVRSLALLPVDFGQELRQSLDPYQCIQGVLEPSEPGTLPLRPPIALATMMLLWTAVLCGLATWRLRVWNLRSETSFRREEPDTPRQGEAPAEPGIREGEGWPGLYSTPVQRPFADGAPGLSTTPATRSESSEDPRGRRTGPSTARQEPRPPETLSRSVWSNPILWREIRTRAYGRLSVIVKLAYAVAVGLIGYATIAPMLTDGPEQFAAAYGLLPVSILSLLLVSAQSVTAITSERDRGALDLLLVTDLTPREFIFGKLAGIFYNVKEFCLPPLLLAGLYAYLGWLASDYNGLALVSVVGTLVVLIVFAAVLGVHIGLRTDRSRLAITHTLGTVFFLSAGTLLCIWLIVISGQFGVQWTSFVLFIGAGVAGLWWVLNGERPSTALTIASWLCPLAMLYAVMNVLIGKPGTNQSSDPVMPFVAITVAFGFTLAAMLVPLLSEFDVALGRTTGGEDN